MSARLADVVASGAAPGIQYVVVAHGATRFDGAAGFADLAARRPLEPDTTMMAYSMTKTVTAVAALQLVERGALSLDREVRSLLPEIPYGDGLTVRHLLAQTSGLPNPIPLRWVHLPEEHAAFDERATLARRLAEHPRLRFRPGARYAYSNLSYWLLGRAIEEVSGLAYAEYVRINVLERLDLSPAQAAFVIPDRDRHARGYLPRWSLTNLVLPLLVDRRFVGQAQGPWVTVEDNFLDGAAFGGLVTSARALGRFLRDLLSPAPVLLGPEGLRLLFEEQRDSSGAPATMTLGWHVAAGPPALLFKEGGGAGFHSEMRLYRAAGMGSVAIGSSGTFRAGRFLDAADREFLGATR